MPKSKGAVCAVCNMDDRRGLLESCLPGGASAVLCGTHAVMMRRADLQKRSLQQMREMFGDRRTGARRLSPASGGAGERRGADRRD